MVSRDNYEVVFIDYFDGKLNKIEQEELFAFIHRNPDLMEEFNHFSPVKTEPDLTIRYFEKDRLKKDTITLFNYKTWLIAYVENDLNNEQRKDVELFLSKNSSMKSELEQFRFTKSVADELINFDKKNSLKKQPKIILLSTAVKRTLTAAAILLIGFLAYSLIREVKTPETMVTEKSSATQKDLRNTQKPNGYPVVQIYNSKENKKSNGKINNPPVINKDNNSEQQAPVNNYFAITDPEAQQEENACDDYHPTAANPNIQQNSISASVHTTVHQPVITLKQAQAAGIDVSEIFTKADLKELESLENSRADLKLTDAKTIFDVAVQKFSQASDIAFEKKENDEGNAVTYAFLAGSLFSIRHTEGK